MKKFTLTLLLLLCILCTGCCNQYFILNSEKEIFYGAFISRDFSHGDVQMYSEEQNITCAGTLFIDEFNKVKDENNKKYSEANIQLSCSDGRLLSGVLSGYTLTNWVGDIQDQFKNKYELNVLSKKEFKNEIGEQKYTKQSYVELINQLVKY